MEIQGELNRIAGTVGLGEAKAACLIASAKTATSVVGLETVGALNLAAGTVGLGYQGVANVLAGTTGLGIALALSMVAPV
jgi:hypothetical protein